MGRSLAGILIDLLSLSAVFGKYLYNGFFPQASVRLPKRPSLNSVLPTYDSQIVCTLDREKDAVYLKQFIHYRLLKCLYMTLLGFLLKSYNHMYMSKLQPVFDITPCLF